MPAGSHGLGDGHTGDTGRGLHVSSKPRWSAPAAVRFPLCQKGSDQRFAKVRSAWGLFVILLKITEM
jgi:hypothetical protein